MTPSKQIPKPLSAEMEKVVAEAQRSMPRCVCDPDLCPHLENALRTLALAIRKQAHEEACKAMCTHCREGSAPKFDGRYWFHDGGFDCVATRILSLSEEAKGE
jgi:hypothetical protein